jgi:transposase
MREQREQVTLNRKEQKRLKVLNDLEAGTTTIQKASVLLGLSLRHVYRLRARYRAEGASALAHGNRGRPPPHRIPEQDQQRVLELIRSHYHDYNDCHLTDVLVEEHDIALSRSTVRRIRHAAGLRGPRKRRAPRHRSRRERYPQRGMLLQIDGSHHDWLEGRGPKLVLIAAIDDATGEVPFALFRPQEDVVGYFLLLQKIIQTHGLPLALYADRHTIFQSPKKATIEQELAGERPRSQFGRLVDELDIQLIPSYSPQARGRIERLFGTLQDRLVKELRQANAGSLEQADQLLLKFLPRFNDRFAKDPAQPESAYRPWPGELVAEAVFCFKYKRTVANDNTVSFSGHPFQIPPDRHRGNYARCRVDVCQQLDGQLSIWYQGRQLISFDTARAGLPQLGKFSPIRPPKMQPLPTKRASRKRSKTAKSKVPWKPPPDHPWRQPWKKAAKSQEKPQ